MCMLHALTNSEKVPGKGTVDMNILCQKYKDWINSEPFDLGITTNEALGPLTNVHDAT